ncbi:MAG: hypothetical protein ACLP8X_35570 [Streptosporangiaceae bacterium]
MSSLDQLNGIPCNSGAGTTQLSYGSGGAVTLTCATPTPTPTINPTPNNNAANPVNVGDLNCGNSATEQGVNINGSNAWYQVTFTDTLCPSGLTITLSGNTGDVFDVQTSAAGGTLTTGVTNFTETNGGTYLIHVYGGSGANFQLLFSL